MPLYQSSNTSLIYTPPDGTGQPASKIFDVFVSWNWAERYGWSRPEEIAAVQVKDHNLEPTVWPGELLFVDLSWRAITLSDLYLLDFAGIPVFRWCHLAVPGIANVSDLEMNQDIPVSELTVRGRVVGRFSAEPIRKCGAREVRIAARA